MIHAPATISLDARNIELGATGQLARRVCFVVAFVCLLAAILLLIGLGLALSKRLVGRLGSRSVGRSRRFVDERRHGKAGAASSTRRRWWCVVVDFDDDWLSHFDEAFDEEKREV